MKYINFAKIFGFNDIKINKFEVLTIKEGSFPYFCEGTFWENIYISPNLYLFYNGTKTNYRV